MTTPYFKAEADYKASKEYHDTVAAMKANGMKQPYIDNILTLAFAAGYNAKKVKQ